MTKLSQAYLAAVASGNTEGVDRAVAKLLGALEEDPLRLENGKHVWRGAQERVVKALTELQKAIEAAGK